MLRISLTSYNVKGLSSPEKHPNLCCELVRLKTHIFLQKTHFRADKVPKLDDSRYSVVYHSTSWASKSKGDYTFNYRTYIRIDYIFISLDTLPLAMETK